MKNGDTTAFPIAGVAFDDAHEGLTKREYFSVMMMQGMLANPHATEETIKHGGDPMESFAEQAVEAADLLLKRLAS